MAKLPNVLVSLALGFLDVSEVCARCRAVCKLWLTVPVRWSTLSLLNENEVKEAGATCEPLFVRSVILWSQLTLLPCVDAWPRVGTVRTLYPTVTDDCLCVVASLPELQELDLMTTRHVTDVGLERLSRLSQLKALRLVNRYEHQNFSDEGVHRLLSHLTGLEKLEFATAVTAKGLRALASLPNLRHLELHSSALQNDVFFILAQCDGLQRLSLARCALLSDFACLSSLRGLLDLTLKATELRDTGLAAVCALPLQSLDISDCFEVTDNGFKHIGLCVSLRKLIINGCLVTDNGFRHLRALHVLTRLGAQECELLTDQALDCVTLLPLQELEISDLQPLVCLPSLRKLRWRTPDNASFTPLCTWVRLEKLEVDGCVLDLWMLPLSLLKLRLSDTDIDDEALRHLARLAGLRTLTLRTLYGCRKFTGSGLRYLRPLRFLHTICVHSDNEMRVCPPVAMPALTSLRWNHREMLES